MLLTGRLALVFFLSVGGTAFVTPVTPVTPVTRWGKTRVHSQAQEFGFGEVVGDGLRRLGDVVSHAPGRGVQLLDTIPSSTLRHVNLMAFSGSAIVTGNFLLGLNFLPLTVDEGITIMGWFVGGGLTVTLPIYFASPGRKLTDALKTYDDRSRQLEFFGPPSLATEVATYQAAKSETEFFVLTETPPDDSSDNLIDVFAASLGKRREILFVPMTEASLKNEIKEVADFANELSLATVGELVKARARSPFSAESIDFVVKVPSRLPKEAVKKILDDAAILKTSAGKALNLYICLPDAAKLPTTLLAVARLDEATCDARANALTAINDTAVQGPTPFFFALLKQAPDCGLPRGEIKDLAVVEKLLKKDDADAIAKAQEILDTYLASSRDDSAVLVALEAFARFGFARRFT